MKIIKKIRNYVKELNRIYHSEPAMHEIDFTNEGFEWIDFNDADSSVVSFIRKDKNNNILILVFNFTPITKENYRIGVPREGFYREILNSDSENFGGLNVGLGGGVFSDREECHGRSFSINLIIPPLGLLILKPE